MTRAVALVLVVLSVVAGCNPTRPAASRTDGPVRLGTTSGTNCLPANRAGSYRMGFDLVHNDGKRAVTVDGIRAVGGSGVEVVESYLVAVPKGPWTLVGVGAWPPDPGPPNWGSRIPAVGPDRLDPSDASLEGWNLVLRLTAGGPGATYDHLVVNYSLRGVRYEAANQIGLEIKQPCF